MALDVYQPCLGGMPRKIKFCQCGKDMQHDLGKIMDALSGGQRAGALSHINRMLESRGHRACLLALKGLVQLQMNEFEGLAETAQQFTESHPENPIASGLSAIAAASKGEIDDAIDTLQNAFRDTDKEIHEVVYDALGIVSQLLVRMGDVLAARAHLSLLAAISPPEERAETMQMLLRLLAVPSVPLLLKQRYELRSCPEDVVWRDAFQAALELAGRGVWAEALARFAALADELPNEPVIWRNVAILAGHLSRPDDAGEAWRRFAALDGVDPQEAIEAEALAQLLLEEEEPTIAEVTQVYPISDSDRVAERLLSERHVDSIDGDLSSLASDDAPPPKAAFWILDRPLPSDVDTLALGDVPNVLGHALLFGRETDREPRVEFVTTKTLDFEAKAEVIRKLLGEYGGDVESEEATGELPVSNAAMTWRWRLPDDLPQEERVRLVAEKQRDVHLNVWPDTPLPQLDNKSPAEVAADPAYRIRLSAVILLMELTAEQKAVQFDFNELRVKLGLPPCEDMTVSSQDLAVMPLTRLHRINPADLSDDDLFNVYGHAWMNRAARAIQRLAPEMLARTSLHSRIDLGEIHYALSVVASNADDALESIHNAQRAAEAAGKSPARWLIHELDIRLMRNEPEACESIIGKLQSQHMNEPGIGEALYAWLVRVGAVTPDGQVAKPPQQQAPPAAATQPAAGEIWTPGGPAPQTGGEEKPGLWVPGMD